MYKPSRYAVKGDPLGDPLGGDLRHIRVFKVLDPVTAAISAGASLLGGAMSSDAASSAADTQSDATRQAAQMQKDEFDQVRNDLAPYRNLGVGSINSLLKAMGYNVQPMAQGLTRDQLYQQLLPQFTTQGSTNNGPPMDGQNYTNPNDYGYMGPWTPNTGPTVDTAGLNAAIDAAMQQQQLQQSEQQYSNMTVDPSNILQQTFSFNPGDLTKTPGYEFNYGQGMRAVNNSAASRGLGLSGAQLKGAMSFASGLADNTYQNQFTNALNTYNTNYNTAAQNVNRLLGLVGNGQNAANQTGAFGMQSVANQGNYLTSGANAQASGMVGSANAMTNALNGIGNNALLYSMLGKNSGAGSGSGVTLYGIRQ